MNLLDFDTLTDTDLSEMLDREIPCEFARMLRDNGSTAPWCEDIATHWVRLRCRSCGRGGRVLACRPCTKVIRRGVQAISVLVLAAPWMKHGNCRWPLIFRVTSGAL